MKRIILSFIILLAAQISFAQVEVAIEQNINTTIGCLNIKPGWDVRLMHRETEGYRVAIVVPRQYEEVAIVDVHECNIIGDTMTINENTLLPRGTIIELEGNLGFRKINVYDNAIVSADHIMAPEATDTYYIYLGKNANFHINHLRFCGEPILSVNDESTLHIDTITGQGEPALELYDGNFEYGQDLLEGKITVKEYEKQNGNYYSKYAKIIKTQMIEGEPVTTERYKIWGEFLSFGSSVGFRRGADAVDFNSPYKYSHNLSINMGLTTFFKFGEHWGLTTGLSYNFNEQEMVHQLQLEDGKLEVIDGQVPMQQNRIISNYLGVPVELNWYLGKRGTESVSLDYYCGYLLGGQLLFRTAANNYKGWLGETARPILNPWKMELGLSFNTQHLGIFHGVRVFVNLLPEYRPSVTTDKFRSVGVEIKL
jgi:hypothetical protein